MDTTLIATEDFLKSVIAKHEERIQQLTESHERLAQRDYRTSAELNSIRENMQEWTFSALDERDISETNAEEIAEICGFELTKEFEVEVTVMYSVTVNARTEQEAQDAIHEIDFDTVSYDGDTISYMASSVDRVDI